MPRLLRRLAVYLLCGVILTVLIAWACGAWISVPFRDHYCVGRLKTTPTSEWGICAIRRPGVQYVAGFPWGGANLSFASPAHYQSIDPSDVDWPAVFGEAPANDGFRHATLFDARGWPWPALWCVVRTGESNDLGRRMPPQVEGGAAWPVAMPLNNDSNPFVYADVIAFGFRPYWRGLIADTILYAGLCAAAHFVGRWLRRRFHFLTVRSLAALVIVCLVLGGGSTFLVAVWCALVVDEDYTPHTSEDGFGETRHGPHYAVWWVSRSSELAALRLRSYWIGSGKSWGSTGPPPSGPAEALVPAWTDFLTPVQDDSLHRTVDARGWPFLSLWGGFTERKRAKNGGIVYDLVSPMHALVLPRYFAGEFRGDYTRVIPLAPIWTGFAADSLLFAVAWFGVFVTIVGPRVFHRSYRHARGRCTTCGYQLAGLIRCPECGRMQATPIARRE